MLGCVPIQLATSSISRIPPIIYMADFMAYTLHYFIDNVKLTSMYVICTVLGIGLKQKPS